MKWKLLTINFILIHHKITTFDMIIGQDPMKKLSMIFDLDNKNWIWGGFIIPMWIDVDIQPKHTLSRSEIKQVVQRTADPKVTREASERIVKIIDSKYDKSNFV